MSKIGTSSKITAFPSLENNNYTLRVEINFPERMRVITQSKEIDIHALVGNIGGYIGLFLGNINA